MARAAPTTDVLPARLSAQLLAGRPARTPGEVVERLLAVQAQDARGFRLAIRARTTGTHVRDVEAALGCGELVVTWLNRGTLHLVTRDDYWWLQGLTTPPLATGNARRLRQEGVSAAAADRGADVIVRALTADGPLTRYELRDRVAAAGVPTERQALVHILMLASLRGLVVRGPMKGATQSWVLVRDWLGTPPPFDRDVALAELARRYLRGHGPASDRDLAKWAGLPLRDARAGLRAVGDEIRERDDGLAELRGSSRSASRNAVAPTKLLGAFDPLLLGWASRDFVLDPAHLTDVVSGGLFRPAVLVNGRIVGAWSLSDRGAELRLFARITAGQRRLIDADVDAVAAFLH